MTSKPYVMKYEIDSLRTYNETMVVIFRLMVVGEENLQPKELKELAAMVKAAEKYENEVLRFSSNLSGPLN